MINTNNTNHTNNANTTNNTNSSSSTTTNNNNNHNMSIGRRPSSGKATRKTSPYSAAKWTSGPDCSIV